uniref:Probable 6-oxopurine nucleoside phosphorylase n=1 Tax=Candidatus Kentrum sp. MB TaxID=2138164 RepID=A0A451B7Q7_9GAMM|nr:MAG: methylthioadenosine phosphorylase [Candidatus Kentron sp. MB]VFK28623.1 MAG: methylthioadenosine phosphorylase [Candidatus Kentron sp. MB]VFK74312.1 MAG: methylthioadenosine phosphorylase [Candidatus Kentron sp. MB]
MITLAIIGGSGLTQLEGLTITRTVPMETPYGKPSAPLVYGAIHDREIVFLARHGNPHTIYPHQINYRANIQALRQTGARKILAVSAVGGIHPELITPDFITKGRLAIPHQIIDYTWSRAHTFFENNGEDVVHTDFTEPYCQELRKLLLSAARAGDVTLRDGGVYGATQGPRFETAAEIDRLERDGCDMVGMTGMPEAILARELGLCYAACAVIANPAAGRGNGEIRMNSQDIIRALDTGMETFRALLKHTLLLLPDSES